MLLKAMDNRSSFWYPTSPVLSSLACPPSSSDHYMDVSYFRMDSSPSKAAMSPFTTTEAFESETVAPTPFVDTKGWSYDSSLRQLSSDSGMTGISPMVSLPYRLAEELAELPARSKCAKRSRHSSLLPTEYQPGDEIECATSSMKRIRLPTADTIAVTIKTLNGHKFALECEPDALVLQVKNEIEVRIGVPGPDQRLLHGGTHLNDYKSLREYNIKDGDTLYMVVSLHGG